MYAHNVTLTDQDVATVADLVATGRFATAADVLREGVRLVQEREQKREALRAAIALGLDDLDAGRYKTVRNTDLPRYIADLGRKAAQNNRQA